MRKVEYVTNGFFGGQNSNALGPIEYGWFHGVFQEGNLEGGCDPVAVVESNSGELLSLGLRQIRLEPLKAN